MSAENTGSATDFYSPAACAVADVLLAECKCGVDGCEHMEALATLGRLDDRLTEGRALVEAADKVAIKSVDDEDWITGYQFRTGAWHRLLAWARSGVPE